jgi:hypothetical protein
MYYVICSLQFLSHPLLSELLTEEDQKVSYFLGVEFISALLQYCASTHMTMRKKAKLS